MRIAAIDIGTNSIHMVIASATGGSDFEVVDREREVVQIGRGSFRGGRLTNDAIRRTVEALTRYVELARRHQVDRILCTATAAVREARNGGQFLQAARRAAGVTPRVIPAEEEGRLIWLGVKGALEIDDKPSLIVDIGGGSMQLVVADRDKLHHVSSAPLGALRLTETLVEEDPASRREIQELRRHIRRHAAEALKAVSALAPGRVYGSSGSIHALAELAHRDDTGEPIERLNGHLLTTESLDRLAKKLQRMSLEEREALPGLDARRAEIIVPGAFVLLHVLESLEAKGILISDFGVREGLVTDYLQSHAQEIRTFGGVEDLKLRSVLQLLHKFTPFELQIRHAEHVAKLSEALFDGLKEFHGLGDDAKAWLRYAALLHDVGAVIGYDGHAEHSYYIVRNGNLRGLDAEEIERIALLTRYHGKGRPRKRDEAFGALRKKDRRLVKWLAAILRVAEGLDRSHYQLVENVRVARQGGRVALLLSARRGARLELWAARRRTDVLERLLDTKVRVDLDPAAESPAADSIHARVEPSPNDAEAGRSNPSPGAPAARGAKSAGPPDDSARRSNGASSSVVLPFKARSGG